jgi:hypothetical protein
LFVAVKGGGIHPGVGFKVGQAESFAKAFEALTQDCEHAFALEFFGEAIEQDGFGFIWVEGLEPFPLFGLSLLNEGDLVFGKERPIAIVVIRIANAIATCGHQVVLNGVFKFNFPMHWVTP